MTTMKQRLSALLSIFLLCTGVFCLADDNVIRESIPIGASKAIDPGWGTNWTYRVISGEKLVSVKKDGVHLTVTAAARGIAKIRLTSATKDVAVLEINVTTAAGPLHYKIKKMLEDIAEVEVELVDDTITISGRITKTGDWNTKEKLLQQLQSEIKNLLSQGGMFFDNSWEDISVALASEIKKINPNIAVERQGRDQTYSILLKGKVTPDEKAEVDKLLERDQFQKDGVTILNEVKVDIISVLEKELKDKGITNVDLIQRSATRIEVSGAISDRAKYEELKQILALPDYANYGIVNLVTFDFVTCLKNELADKNITNVKIERKSSGRIEITGTFTDKVKYAEFTKILAKAEYQNVGIEDNTNFDISERLKKALKDFKTVQVIQKAGACCVTGEITDALEWKKFSEIMKNFPEVENQVRYTIDTRDIENLKKTLEAEGFTVEILDKSTDKNYIYPVNTVALFFDHEELFVGSRMLCQQDIDKVEEVLKKDTFYLNANVKKEKKLILDENETLDVAVYLIKETDSNNFSRNTKINIGLTMNADFFRTLMDGNARGKTAKFGANLAGNLDVLKTNGLISEYTIAKKTIKANAKEFQKYSNEKKITLTVPGSETGSVQDTAGVNYSVRASFIKEKSGKDAQDVLCAMVEFESCKFTSADTINNQTTVGGPKPGALVAKTYYFGQPNVLMHKDYKQKVVNKEGTPILKDLPLLGWLFSNKVEATQNVTYTIVAVVTREGAKDSSTVPANGPRKPASVPPDYDF